MWEIIKIKAATKRILQIDPGDTFTCIKIIYLGVQFMLFERDVGDCALGVQINVHCETL